MALRTSGDIMTEVLVRNNRSTTDGFISDVILQGWLKDAHEWAAGYRKWPVTEGRNSTTFASYVTNEDGWLQGSYPEGYKSDSIRKLTIGGKNVQKVNFYKFQKFLEDNPNATDRIFTDRARSLYVNPNIDLSGTLVAWGQYTPALDVTDLTSLSVFADADQEGNEAIVLAMTSYLFSRESPSVSFVRGKMVSSSISYFQRATDILDQLWKKIGDEQFGYQSTQDDGMFKRFDVLRGGFKEDLFRRDQFF